MNLERQAFCSKTTYPNDRETDRLPRVWNDVEVKLQSGKNETVRLMAPDPLEAIRIVNGMDDEAYAKLERVANLT
jgi:hypothetical protein